MSGPWEDFKGSGDADGPWRDFQPRTAEDRPQTAQEGARAIISRSPMSWGETLTSALKRIPASAGNLLAGLGHAAMHPVDTYHSMVDLAGGEAEKLTPKPVADFLNKFENPEDVQRAENTATQVNQFYQNRYGSVEGFKNALAKDPVGVAADLSTVLGGAGAVAGTIPKAGKVAEALNTASSYTNPINAGAQAVKGAGKLAALGAKTSLGLTTMTGPNTIEEAAKAGYAGNSSFMDNLTGKVPVTDVLADAKQNLQNMIAAKSAEYRRNMVAVSNDKSILSFNDIDKAISDADQMTKFKGQVKNVPAAKVVQDIAEEVNNWKNLNPADFHTPEGLDALKQKIGGIVQSIPYQERTASTAGHGIYRAIKKTIADQAPTYNDTMKAYSDASEQITEIQRALSMSPNASADTAMRKLQSVLRNNVNTNYGNRLSLARTLQDQGGNEILPAIAGQAMNSWLPRGAIGQYEPIGTALAAFSHPPVAASLPFQSPRLVGAATYGAGRLAKALTIARERFPMTNQQAKLAALLLSQSGEINSR